MMGRFTPDPMLTPSQLEAARDWCLEVWPDSEDEIQEATPKQIEQVIAKTWDGGISDFIECNKN